MYSKWNKFKKRHDNDIAYGLRSEVLGKLCQSNIGRRFVQLTMAPGCTPKKNIFIVGCYNSGTTLTQRILSSGSNISTPPFEGITMTSALSDLEFGGWPRMMYQNKDKWDEASSAIIHSAKGLKNDWHFWVRNRNQIFLEKSIANSIYIEKLNTIFENSKFIVIRRNGYCVNEGILRRTSEFLNNNPDKLLSYTEENLAQQWVEINNRIDSSLKNNNSNIEIKYEEICARPLETITKLFEFIEIPTPSLIDRGRGSISVNNRVFNVSNRNDQSLENLTLEQKDRMWARFSDQMAKYGYHKHH